MLACVFLILTAYYVMKTAREGLILSGGTWGDTLSAVLVGLGIHRLHLTGRDLAVVNVGLVGVWLVIAYANARKHRILSPDREREARPTHNAGAPTPAGAIA